MSRTDLTMGEINAMHDNLKRQWNMSGADMLEARPGWWPDPMDVDAFYEAAEVASRVWDRWMEDGGRFAQDLRKCSLAVYTSGSGLLMFFVGSHGMDLEAFRCALLDRFNSIDPEMAMKATLQKAIA